MMYKFKHKGFSMTEVLMTLMIVSLVMVLFIPVMTKKLSQKSADGVVYTYSTSKKESSPKKCFITAFSNTNIDATGWDDAEEGECSEYEFVVPNGVHYLNLTLVAGGGGGGGASGLVYKKQRANAGYIESKDAEGYIQNNIKNIKIDYITSRGEKAGIYNANTCTSGNGGKSSYAILNYEIPSYMYKTFNQNNIVYEGYTTNGMKTRGLFLQRAIYYDAADPELYNMHWASLNPYAVEFFHGNPIYLENDVNGVGKYFMRYGVCSDYVYTNLGYNTLPNGEPCSGHPNHVFCEYINTDGTTYSSCGNDERSEYLPDRNRIVAHAGSNGYQLKPEAACNSFKTSSNEQYIAGGIGGTINDVLVAGQGGSGCSIHHKGSETKAECTGMPNNEGDNILITTTEGFEEDKKITGGAGSGGNAVRIIGFKVNPGETYIVRVGKGGKGGAAGQDYTYEEGTSNNSNYADLTGKDGNGGVSTSISKKESSGETLIFAVMGGKGGQGAYYKKDTSSGNGRSPGNHTDFIYNHNVVNIDNINIDESIASKTNNQNSDSTFCSGCTRIEILYKFLNNENSPYWVLNTSTEGNIIVPQLGKGLTTSLFNSADKSYIRGFSGFNHPTGTTGNHLQSANNITVDGNTYNNVYDGFYYRNYLNGGEIGYVGGLGGFSGLGGKAGCGGYFMGNYKGARVKGTNNTEIDNFVSKLASKIIVKNRAYDVKDYYDGCTVNSPDGQSAVFVAPSPKDMTFGQAGAGGGGGGYGIEAGPGKGGDGQNGYVMIDWRK